MPVRVSPTEPNPTHHVSLRPRNGPTVGLILCDSEGNPRWEGVFKETAIERTSLKTASGESSYSDLDYPYGTVVQDDWSGGRGSLDFERDNTKFFDSFRLRTGLANKAFLGPQEQWATGDMRDFDHSVPDDVAWKKLLDANQYLSVRFEAGASYTAALAWLLMRKRGEPEDLTIAVHNDSAGSIGTEVDSITVAESRMDDILSEWLCETISAALTSGSYYWIKVYASDDDDLNDHWQIGVKDSSGTTNYSSDGSSWSSASFDLYYRLTDANSTKTVIPFTYKEQQYFVESGASGAPTIYMAGYRGAADDNSGNLDKLIDGTQSWETDELIGGIVLITAGPGVGESQRWREITANSGTQVTVDEDWVTTHTTSTEYVILLPKLVEITGHDITAPVTDVLITPEDVVLFAQGDDTNMRRHRAFNDSGTWKDFGHADCKSDDGTNKATFLVYKPQAQKIVKGNNSDGSDDISVDTADAVAWGNHTFSGSPTALSGSGRMTSLWVYPDSEGDEAVWVGREDLPWVVPGSGNPYPFQIEELETLKAGDNANWLLTHDVYLFMPVRNLMERWYNGSLDDVGPNDGEGLPANRQGPVVDAVGYPGKVLIAVDAGDDGYSSVLALDNGGYHEYYRAPEGQRITAMAFQPVEGALDRLWICVANDMIWLPFPNTPSNELDESDHLYTHEGCLTLSRMHAGMLDVQKLTRYFNLWTEDMEEDEQWFEIDYRLDDESAWTTYDEELYDEPVATIDFGDTRTYGLGAKRFQLRVRFYTTDASSTPVLKAVLLETVLRIKNKYIRPLVFRLMDEEPCLSPGEVDDIPDPLEKLQELKDMADATSNTLVLMRSVSQLYDGQMVFLNSIETEHIKIKHDPNNEHAANVYVCSTTVQDA